MSEKYTVTQAQRLTELNADKEIIEKEFADADSRNAEYKAVEKELVKEGRIRLKELLDKTHMPLTACIEKDLTEWLTGSAGFTKVATPIIITGENLDDMSITKDNPLREQVFWTGKNRCLRPMLAPNLYIVMREIYKITNEPVRIFECGSCFRKESQGAMHMNEFTMLNMVELAGTAEGGQDEQLEKFAHGAMEAVGINNYEIVRESSNVYGETMDIVADGIELASGAYGPLPAMDSKWGIFDVWVGLGLGIERIAMIKGEYQTIKRAGKSISYIDGIPFKL